MIDPVDCTNCGKPTREWHAHPWTDKENLAIREAADQHDYLKAERLSAQRAEKPPKAPLCPECYWSGILWAARQARPHARDLPADSMPVIPG